MRRRKFFPNAITRNLPNVGPISATARVDSRGRPFCTPNAAFLAIYPDTANNFSTLRNPWFGLSRETRPNSFDTIHAFPGQNCFFYTTRPEAYYRFLLVGRKIYVAPGASLTFFFNGDAAIDTFEGMAGASGGGAGSDNNGLDLFGGYGGSGDAGGLAQDENYPSGPGFVPSWPDTSGFYPFGGDGGDGASGAQALGGPGGSGFIGYGGAGGGGATDTQSNYVGAGGGGGGGRATIIVDELENHGTINLLGSGGSSEMFFGDGANGGGGGGGGAAQIFARRKFGSGTIIADLAGGISNADAPGQDGTAGNLEVYAITREGGTQLQLATSSWNNMPNV
jgi:hypothetical protein